MSIHLRVSKTIDKTKILRNSISSMINAIPLHSENIQFKINGFWLKAFVQTTTTNVQCLTTILTVQTTFFISIANGNCTFDKVNFPFQVIIQTFRDYKNFKELNNTMKYMTLLWYVMHVIHGLLSKRIIQIFVFQEHISMCNMFKCRNWIKGTRERKKKFAHSVTTL